jgi:hypothetical protein
VSAADRSRRAEVRNPVLRMAAVQQIREFPASYRLALCGLLRELAADAAERANKSWRTHKAPMALYWKAVAVYARHIARAIA